MDPEYFSGRFLLGDIVIIYNFLFIKKLRNV